jgi:hypothetical protein
MFGRGKGSSHKTAGTRLKWRRSFRISYTRPKTASRSWRQMSPLIAERADRAEQWLHRVYTEIEDRFLQQSDSGRAMTGAPQRPQSARRRAD